MDSKNLKFTEFKSMALHNQGKPAAELAPGDFVYLIQGNGKESNFTNWHRWSAEYHTRLCKIVAVIDVAGFLPLDNWLGRAAPEHRGGSESADVPDGKQMWELTPEEVNTFYGLVTVYRNSRGQWFAVDCQGHDYWRYVHLPVNYRDLFAEEILDADITIMMEEARLAVEKEMELKQHADAYAARLAELRAQYPYLKESPDNTRAVCANFRKYIKHHLPDLDVKVTGRKSYFNRSGVDLTVTGINRLSYEAGAKIRELLDKWRDTLPTGKEYTWSDGSEGEANGAPMADLFGEIDYLDID